MPTNRACTDQSLGQTVGCAGWVCIQALWAGSPGCLLASSGASMLPWPTDIELLPGSTDGPKYAAIRIRYAARRMRMGPASAVCKPQGVHTHLLQACFSEVAGDCCAAQAPAVHSVSSDEEMCGSCSHRPRAFVTISPNMIVSWDHILGQAAIDLACTAPLSMYLHGFVPRSPTPQPACLRAS
jgi:hypothetical protein